jgi:hypothetical protein
MSLPVGPGAFDWMKKQVDQIYDSRHVFARSRFCLREYCLAVRQQQSRHPAKLGGEEGIRTLDTALDRITV